MSIKKCNNILVTGGCGFIGSNFIRYLLANESSPRIVNIDNLTYAGNLENLSSCLNHPKLEIVKGDITDEKLISKIFSENNFDAIFNFAAESHVDRSITNPNSFFKTNVGGTLVLLQQALENNVERFVQISTDEVYGSLGLEGSFNETTPLDPRSPYSASKASADNFVQAFYHTHGLNTIITRCSNNYGPYQFPEKLIPLMINNLINKIKLPVYGDGSNIRDWIHVEDHCKGVWSAFMNGNPGEVYNLGGECELSNLDLVKKLILHFDLDYDMIEFVEDRQGHDFRYAMNIKKAREKLNWNPNINFEIGIQDTIEWYISNKKWLDSVTSGDYINYYEKMYG